MNIEELKLKKGFGILLLKMSLLAVAASAQPFGDFVYVDSHFMIRTDENDPAGENWACHPQLTPNRCYWTTPTPPAPMKWQLLCPEDPTNKYDTGSSNTRYEFNGIKSVHVPAGKVHGGFVYHFVQFNSVSGRCPRYDQGICSHPEGPFGIQRGLRGDEYLLFRCPEIDGFCASSEPELVQDRMRPNNLDCDVDGNPITCDAWSWQFKSADYASHADRVRVWVKVQGMGPLFDHNDPADPHYLKRENIIKPAHVAIQSIPSSSLLRPSVAWNQNGGGSAHHFRTAFKYQGDDRWCKGEIVDSWRTPNPADCPDGHRIRITDSVFVPDGRIRILPIPAGVTVRKPCTNNGDGTMNCPTNYAGLMNWQEDTSPVPSGAFNSVYDGACVCCEPGIRGGVICRNGYLMDRASFVVIVVGVGVWFADYHPNGTFRRWLGSKWGEYVPFNLPAHPGINHRTSDLSKVTIPGLSAEYHFWQSRGLQECSTAAAPPCLDTNPLSHLAFACNYPDVRERELAWGTLDLEFGYLNGANSAGSTALSQMRGVAWMPSSGHPSSYKSGIVGWNYDYFEYRRPVGGSATELVRYVSFGTKDTVACRYAMKYTETVNLTGKAIVAHRVRHPNDP